MKRLTTATLALTLCAALLGGCASMASAPAKVSDGILTGPHGMTLYTFDKDAAGSGKSVADFRREALAFGTKMFACPTALASHGIDAAELIPGLAGQAGAAAFIGRTLDPAWRSLSF